MRNLRNYRSIHPDLLPGLVNTALRDDYADLEDLTLACDIDRAGLEARMAELGYHYLPEVKQFRQIDTDASVTE